MWSRLGAGSRTVVTPVGIEAREQHGRLHLRARHRQVPGEGSKRTSVEGQGWLAVDALCPDSHGPQRRRHALDGPAAKGRVAGQRAAKRPPGQRAGQDPQG